VITPDGWLDWAKRDPGPPDKVYSQPNASIGYVPHSAVGYYGGWRSRLDSLERDPDDPRRYSKYTAASVTGWIAYDGTVTHHYPFSASCWASGNRYANTHFNAFENEGGYPNLSEPLTEGQIESSVRIIGELSAWKGWTPERGVNLLEHHECVERWGGDATSCPNGRIPWGEILRRLANAGAKEDDMFLKWAFWGDWQRRQKPFRSYRICIGTDGAYKVQDPDGKHFDAMQAALGKGRLIAMSLADLKAIPSAPGTPDPDA